MGTEGEGGVGADCGGLAAFPSMRLGATASTPNPQAAAHTKADVLVQNFILLFFIASVYSAFSVAVLNLARIGNREFQN